MGMNSSRGVRSRATGQAEDGNSVWAWVSRREQEKAKFFARPAVAPKRISHCGEWNMLEVTLGSCISNSQSFPTSADYHEQTSCEVNAELFCLHTEELALLNIYNSYCHLPNCLYKRQFVVINMDFCHVTITESYIKPCLVLLSMKDMYRPSLWKVNKFLSCVNVFKRKMLSCFVFFFKSVGRTRSRIQLFFLIQIIF